MATKEYFFIRVSDGNPMSTISTSKARYEAFRAMYPPEEYRECTEVEFRAAKRAKRESLALMDEEAQG